jgi:hypothetical protein
MSENSLNADFVVFSLSVICSRGYLEDALTQHTFCSVHSVHDRTGAGVKQIIQ